MVTTPDGQVNIAQVRRGDLVLTRADDGNVIYTPVRSISFIPGEFSFVTFVFEDADVMPLTVTPDHGVMVWEADSFAIIKANRVRASQRMLLFSGTQVAPATVASVHESLRTGKYSIATEHCTVFANRVLTATNCEETSRADALLQYAEDKDEFTNFSFEYFARELQKLGVGDITTPQDSCSK